MKKNASDNNDFIGALSHRLAEACRNGAVISYSDARDLPQSDKVVEILKELLELLHPGYSGRRPFWQESLDFSLGERLATIYHQLTEQLLRATCYKCRVSGGCKGKHETPAQCRQEAEKHARHLLERLPDIREMLALDCQAALDGDPATRSIDEIILAYPGYKAIAIHRIAHELYAAGIPIVPRIMSEYAHAVTGIDINPGATIGKSFFIDHGTGVVIGETAVLGDNVKLYQGVTLGALSFPKDGCGQLIKGAKRHPNLEDNVTVYAGATILGDITIAHHSVIGGNVWLTESVTEPYSKVIFSPSDISVVVRRPTRKKP